ncbi:MAG TPA: Hsp33 family molecular chaperone HslO, partial [Spirochaetota bacterium]|nr:Hsp33 family molecular chaperone HslO [Spirochaetota bacterium]
YIVSSAIFSRAMVGAVLLSGNLKNSTDSLSLKWDCSGEAKNIFVEVTGNGNVKGYIGENNLKLIEKSLKNNFILSEPYIGFGEITLTRNSVFSKMPYNSLTVIETGEIAEDLSLHIKQSLQIESAIKIGLSIDSSNNIETCGGVLFMAMPNCSNEEIDLLHKTFNELESLTDLLMNTNNDLEQIEKYFAPLDLQSISTRAINFNCNCNILKIKNILKSLKKEDLQDYLSESGKIEASCQYCGKKYIFNETNLE